MQYRIKFGLIIILLVLLVSLLASRNANPDSPFFALKRVQEKVFLSFKVSPKDRVEYLSFLLDNRLQELSEPVKKGNHKFVLLSALRYSATAGQITDLIISNNLKEYVEPIKTKFSNQSKILYDLYVFYPKNVFEDEEYKYIEDDVNYLKIYVDKLSKI